MPERVLVVDSDFAARVRAVGALVTAGYELSVADNPWEAMRIATAEAPALVLVGDAFARSSGPALIGRLLAAPETSGTPVLVVADDEAARVAADRAGAHAVVAGPLDPVALVSAVSATAGDRRPLRRAPEAVLSDEARLAAVAALRPDVTERAALDRFTALTREMLGVPVSTISLIEKDRQLWASQAGLAQPWATTLESPLDYSYCQYAITTREPLLIDDATEHPLVSDSPAIPEMEIVSYLGIPIITDDDQAVGTLCAIDSRPRKWTEHEVSVLNDLGQILTAHFNDTRARRGRHTA